MIHASRCLAACALLLLPAWLLGPQDPQDPTAPLQRQGKFLRDHEVCADCHEDEAQAIAQGVHERVPTSPHLDACETCHGPGAAHAEEQEASQITLPSALKIAGQRRLCATCHADQIADHGGPLRDLLAAGKRCTSCHKVHETRERVPGARDLRVFHAKRDLEAAAKAVGMPECLSCHHEKAETLRVRTHGKLLWSRQGDPAVRWDARQTCESCHGRGSLHAETNGLTRMITRPDVARDGNETCRRCHEDVHPVEFHWKDRHDPLLGAPRGQPFTCATCHRVHGDGDPTLARPRTAGGGERGRRPTSRPARAAPATRISTALDRSTPAHACVRCHAPAYEVLHGTIHASLGRIDGPLGVGCVSCHPGGGLHAQNGGQKDLVVSLRGTSAVFQARVCQACHGRDDGVCGYALGVHAKAGVACLECHSPAAPRDRQRMQADAHKRCASCHAAVALSFRHANRHPIGQVDRVPNAEAQFTCSICHDPHQPIRLRPNSARRMSKKCVDCHREYRGPFVFPHHADKGLGCLACHEPHGSSNRKLLSDPEVRANCLRCHADLPPFHDQRPGSQFRNCLNCHTQVHGSNRSRFFFR